MSISDCQLAPHLAVRDSGERALSAIRWVVLHVAEAPNAAGVAAYFASPNARGSAHVVVDDSECIRCMHNDRIPWGAVGANTDGLHVEICGYAAWTRAEWLRHPERLDRAAYRAARWCHRFDLPVVAVTHRGLRAGRRGITTHHAVNRWQTEIGAPGDHSHTCPYPAGTTQHHFPLDHLMARVRHFHAALEQSH